MPTIDRNAVLNHDSAFNCTLYRLDEDNPDAEERDLGDAKVLFEGRFEPPADWDAAELEEYYDGSDPELFFSARIECEAEPSSDDHFEAAPGDFVAVVQNRSGVTMYFVYEQIDGDDGPEYVLIRDDED
ncbi:hypothetical protein [Stutzerimonas kirkiae]|uniref:Uncharacterized protein n=1 Tax=Stutzerimonas kirkiae TaxID=2211392 RepID=A0A4Q9RA70_9GAMM|nr:hypothetical protein [Stutzerimonas kirkiae]TBU96873.1 hypothetical protein DNJ96_09945 [Stutzerimonas kirkiae]TBV00529.1 hypothetical protein DNJ95_14525 [Stutzerimonas kirkiae]TBV04014.1 hypothetical protein DNK08_17385 [Stutzerimonas kirkiae]TBV16736.1 hypothetical protein DNK01_02465 [Stutzerimonas kirkiae]